MTSAFISFLVICLWQRSYWEPLVQVYKGSAVIVGVFSILCDKMTKIIGERSCSNFVLLLFFGCTFAHRCSFIATTNLTVLKQYSRGHNRNHDTVNSFSIPVQFHLRQEKCKMICCRHYVPFLWRLFSEFYFLFLYLTLPLSVLNLDRSNMSFYLRQRCTKPDSVQLTPVTTFFFSWC